ncbi:MAG: tetratricopeptide repeat protein [Spirochaetes bacterium]|nr:tetratricopeptide repeat protein [Spirochaetota bacterium]
MKYKNMIIGILLILLSFIMLVFYFHVYKPEKEARAMFTEAKMIFERNNTESINRSIDLFTKIISVYPKSKYVPAAYFFIARGNDLTGLNQLAYTQYTYILKNQMKKIDDKTRNIILTRIAHLKLMRNQSDEAINDLLMLLKDTANSESKSRIYAELGQSYFHIGQYEKAIESFNYALLENGRNEEAILGKARVLKKTGRDTETYEIYRDFLTYFGNESQYTDDVKKAYNNQAYYSGLNSYRKGNYQSAIAYFSYVITKFPDNKLSENAIYWTGECYFSMKNYQKAVEYFQKGIDNTFHHKDEDCRIKKGYSYFMMKRYDLAAREFQIYLEQHQNGKYTVKAKTWKDAATRELEVRYRLENEGNDVSQNSASDSEADRESAFKQDDLNFDNSEVGGVEYVLPGNNQKVFLESITEI